MLKNYFTKLFSKLMDKIHPAAIAFHDAYHSALDDDDDELSSKLEEFRQHLVSVVNHNDFCRLGNNDPLPSTSLFFFPNECIFHELFDFCVMLIEV
jgi:hypothetical protein